MSDKAVGEAIAFGMDMRIRNENLANAKRAIANLDLPPASVRFQQGRATSVAKRLADMVRERGIREGTLAIRIARKIEPSVYHGQVLTTAGARFTVVDPAQADA